MKTTEEAHYLTENIYKNLSNKFNPLARQMLINARSYHKALLATSSAARGYIETIARFGHECKSHASVGTEDIGQSIYRVAESYKEIQIKFEECTKAIFAEFILPLEQKLDTELKACVAEQRKYHQGHKEFSGPYQKAVAALGKCKKKNQSKGIFDAEKEAPQTRAVAKCKERLDEFRLQGLKLAILEERKCYCFILSRLVSVSTIQLHYHDRALDCLTDDLVVWRQLAAQPRALPPAVDALLRPNESDQPKDALGLRISNQRMEDNLYLINTANNIHPGQSSYISSRHYDQEINNFQPVQSVESWKTFQHSTEQLGSQTSYDETNQRQIGSFGGGLSNLGSETVPNTPGANRRPKSLHESTTAALWNNPYFNKEDRHEHISLGQSAYDNETHSSGHDSYRSFSSSSPPLPPPPPDDKTWGDRPESIIRQRSNSIGAYLANSNSLALHASNMFMPDKISTPIHSVHPPPATMARVTPQMPPPPPPPPPLPPPPPPPPPPPFKEQNFH